MTEQLLPLFIIHTLSLMSPGPDVFFVLSSSSTSLASGVRAGLGIFIGNVLLVLFVLLLGTQIFTHFPELFVWFKLLGSLYLCWLGVKICYATLKEKNSSSSKPQSPTVESTHFQLAKGCLMCLTNPKAVLYFTSFLPQYLFVNGDILWSGVTTVLILSLIWFMFVAFFGNRFFSNLSPKMKRAINFSFGLVLIIFSVMLFLSEGSQ